MKDCSAAPEENERHRNHANEFDRFVSKEVQERTLDRVDAGTRRSPIGLRGLDEFDFENVGDLLGQEHVGGRRVAVRLRVGNLFGSLASVADLKVESRLKLNPKTF